MPPRSAAQRMARVNVDADTWTALRIEAVRTNTSIADYLGRLVDRSVARLNRHDRTETPDPHDERHPEAAAHIDQADETDPKGRLAQQSSPRSRASEPCTGWVPPWEE